MRLAGRAQAAVDILSEIIELRRPAAEALKDWGKAHRFAGSTDRALIGNLVYDVLRRKASLAHTAASEKPRTLVLTALHVLWNLPVEAVVAVGSDPHGPGALTADETARLAKPVAPSDLPWISGDYPKWLDASLTRTFGEGRSGHGSFLAMRAPVDLRVNTLKASRQKVLRGLMKLGAGEGPWSPDCIRLPVAGWDERNPNVEAEPAHGKGWFEVQDAGSQVAAWLTAAAPGEQVADICAGSGGKTLALAALMKNRGQIHAYDADKHRLRPIFERITRAGARNVQVIPSDQPQRLDVLAGKLDAVLIDAPCSGSGAWRRKPDAKWRLRPDSLKRRLAEQASLLNRAAGLVKLGGRVVYVTCSVLAEENVDQIDSFLRRHSGFRRSPYPQTWGSVIGTVPPRSSDGDEVNLLLTPRDHNTDGFFIAIMERQNEHA
jgi:16S rRNA (cytosine967-C5)-methyltransferase